MKLPDGDGSDVFQVVRTAQPRARVVLITGFRTELQNRLERIVQEGADAVCYKPFDMPHLLDTVGRLSSGE
jgi:DNA-binding response OmpR family regulator